MKEEEGKNTTLDQDEDGDPETAPPSPYERISASDLERYGFCPLSWWLQLQGEEAKSEQAKKGIEAHKKLARSARKIFVKDQRSKKYEFLLVMFSIIVIMLSGFAIMLYFSGLSDYLHIVSFYINLFSIVWLLLACAFFFTVLYKDRQINRLKKNYIESKVSLRKSGLEDQLDGFIPWLKEEQKGAWLIGKWFSIVIILMGIFGMIAHYFPSVEIYIYIFSAIFCLMVSVIFYYFLNKGDGAQYPKFFTKDSEYKTISMAIVASGLAIFAVLTSYYELSATAKILVWSSLLWATAALFFFFSAVNTVGFLSKQYYKFYLKFFHKRLEELSLSELIRLLVRRREEYRRGSIWLVTMSLFLAAWGFILKYAMDLPASQKHVLGRLLLIVALIWLIGAFLVLYYLIKNVSFSKKMREEKGIIEDAEIDYVDTLDEKTDSTLYGTSLNISGKPDLILEQEGYYIPQEIKTGKIPRGPYFSHILQLAAYMKLVEENYSIKPPYGYIQYGDKIDNRYQIHYDDNLEDLLREKVEEMEQQILSGEVHRNHHRFGKCKNCSRKDACPESLDVEEVPDVRRSDVEKGEEIEVVVTGSGKKGDGVSRVGGYVVFTPGLEEGDRAKVKVKKIRGNLVFTKLVELLDVDVVGDTGPEEKVGEEGDDEEKTL